jgi:mRNA-degrading endonuclease RelE of RelBE toxin-antitoxin system
MRSDGAALLSEDPYSFKLSQQAASYLRRQNADTKKRINDALVEATKDPIGASDHLVNRGAERKVRVGGLRILFRIDSVAKLVLVDAILPRGDIYKHTRR